MTHPCTAQEASSNLLLVSQEGFFVCWHADLKVCNAEATSVGVGLGDLQLGPSFLNKLD